MATIISLNGKSLPKDKISDSSQQIRYYSNHKSVFYQVLVTCISFLFPQWWASCAGGCGFNPWLRQTKVFKTGSNGFPPWCSGLWE